MDVILLIIGVLFAAILAPFNYLLFKIVASVVKSKKRKFVEKERFQRNFCIIVPAHNEENIIAATVTNIKFLDYPKGKFDVVVIADNCRDSTAELARKAGARVIERFDDQKKSKGYALHYFFEMCSKLGLKDYDAYVVIDADTFVDANLLKVFDAYLDLGAQWIQCHYSVRNPEDHWRAGLLKLALGLFNGIWLWGQELLGLGSAFRGNGMCFRREALKRFPWQAYGLTEDLEFSWRLRLRGEFIHFAPETSVYGEMVVDHTPGITSQRQRWEEGRKELKKAFFSDIMSAPDKTIMWRFLAAADLLMWPLSRFVFLNLLSGMIGFGAYYFGGAGFMPFGLMGLSVWGLGSLVVYIALPWIKLNFTFGDYQPLLFAPFFMLWKISISLRKKPEGWVRTPRNTEKKETTKAS